MRLAADSSLKASGPRWQTQLAPACTKEEPRRSHGCPECLQASEPSRKAGETKRDAARSRLIGAFLLGQRRAERKTAGL